jgi:hypothetical protein
MHQHGNWELVGKIEGAFGGPQTLTFKRRVEGGHLYHVMVMWGRWRTKLSTSLAFVPDPQIPSEESSSGGYD